MPDNRDEPLPAISITETNSGPPAPVTPPGQARSVSSPRNRLELPSPTVRLREKLESTDAKRAESSPTVQERLLNLWVRCVLCP